MDLRYPAYCVASPRFYETPERVSPDEGWVDYGSHIEAPSGWRRSIDEQWVRIQPPLGTPELPVQGWKIHVSSTPENAIETLKKVADHCFKYTLHFKFLPHSLVMQARSAKYAPREASGKFITVYTRSPAELRRTLEDLDQEIGGWPGPYILSDLRWNEGPLYIRYGAFILRFAHVDDGTQIPAIERPDGVLVADHREPRFVLPEWVEVPDFLAETVRPRMSGERPPEFPYDVLGVLHFSNGGGVYRARRLRDGTEVVLKEGRPYAGLDRTGEDATARLRTEYAVLSDLQGLPGIPQVFDYHTLGGHEFLAMEHVYGQSLQSWVAQNYLFLSGTGDGNETQEYRDSVDVIMDQLEQAVRNVHERGYVFNDLHPGNVMIDEDLNISLIDFEAVRRQSDAGPRPLGVPGFVAPDSLRGFQADRYSLNAIRLCLYFPLISLLALCPAKAAMFIDTARDRLELDEDVVTELRRSLAAPGPAQSGLRPAHPELAFTTAAGPWHLQERALQASIRRTATPDREDRLFPGDINQFFHGGGGIAFGAAGVIDALHTAGVTELDPYVDWLEHDILTSRVPRLGLYDGAAGICRVLHRMGRADTAFGIYDKVAEESAGLSGTKLFDGLSGIGLTSLDFYRRSAEPRFLDHAVRAAAVVEEAVDSGRFAVGAGSLSADSLLRDRNGNAVENFWGGLLYGWSGLALFMIRVYEVTGEERWRRAAVAALHRDLDECEAMPDGTLQVKNGARVLPYLATGSAGVAVVGDLLLHHVSDERIEGALPDLSLACVTEFSIGAGLFNGRTGLIGALHQVKHRLDWPDVDKRVDEGVASLNLHALSDEFGLIFPGEQNLRASSDLGTGSAGVLQLINVLAGRTSELLPFLGPEPWTPPHRDPSATAAGVGITTSEHR
ncbi:class III lanthionine synthetase LanKC [Streptomyces sp. NL15-2K]|uniref:class III lanthionine synthetase LanKC n=1 Tax=Streptomyces sp. NL15-2K TaxID=376149 RepID=UPI000F58CA01|nr:MULTISPECIES: class III lanthionine synthetase LanKC [Actinomycetes]WKX13864.1 class III lanthionine synthetase LanKC [Kutzneria buriramensis]